MTEPGGVDQLVTMLAAARVVDLSQPSHAGMPQLPAAPRFLLTLLRRHGDLVREAGVTTATELIVGTCHAGTHIDAIGHVGVEGRLWEGHPVADAQTTSGLRHLDVELITPVVTRGVLIDVAALHGTARLPPAAGVDAAQLQSACDLADLEVRLGDAVLIRTGWGSLWDDPDRYVSASDGVPGIDEQGARWLADRRVRVAGADCLMFERYHPSRDRLPVHALLVQGHGIPLIENMLLEELAAANTPNFIFIAAPLRLRGATGSPIRPLAILLGDLVRAKVAEPGSV